MSNKARWARDIIKQSGWAVHYEPGVGQPAPYGYTIGLTEAGLPELLIAGMAVYPCWPLLNTAARDTLRVDFLSGQTVDVGGCPFRVFTADPAPVDLARQLYPYRALRVLQLVWPHPSGVWPWEPGWPDDTPQPIYSQEVPQK